MTEKKQEKTLVVCITWGLGRVVAMSGAITELSKKRPVKVITSRPIVFRANPYVEAYGMDHPNLFKTVIKGNDYLELEPYTDSDFFNDGKNRLEVAKKQLWLEKVAQPILYLAEHEKENAKVMNIPQGKIPVLYQPFWSTMEMNWSDKSYRSLKIEDAQYVADLLNKNGFVPMLVIKPWTQPKLKWCQILDTPDLRGVMSLCSKYPVFWADSCLHHCAKAFWKKSCILWAWTDSERFGYESDLNLREFPMVEHTPMRLPMNDFNFDISNQHTNKFTKPFLEEAVKEFTEMVKKEFKF